MNQGQAPDAVFRALVAHAVHEQRRLAGSREIRKNVGRSQDRPAGGIEAPSYLVRPKEIGPTSFESGAAEQVSR